MQTISGLVYLGVLGSLCSLLQSPDPDLLLAVCDALGAALEAGEQNRQATGGGDNYCAQLIDEAGGVDKLEELQSHENVAVYERASRLIVVGSRLRLTANLMLFSISGWSSRLGTAASRAFSSTWNEMFSRSPNRTFSMPR